VREVRPERVSVTGDGYREELTILLLAVANSDQYGNNARIAPGARVDDGELDLVAVPPVGLLGPRGSRVAFSPAASSQSPGVRRLRGARFVIDRIAPGLIHTDGETHPAGSRIEVQVHPAASVSACR
jgi:diacylglycerol kinase family enzyme